MTRTIAERLAQAADDGFVGRDHEVAVLSDAIATDEPPFLAAFVHGPGGIGKSRLLHAVLARTGPEVRAILLDGRDVEPTPRGLRQSVGRALGIADDVPDTASIVASIIADPRRTVLAIDTYEVLGLLDTWLRTTFLPALPASVLTVFAGRDGPGAAWHTAPGWSDLVADLPLAALAADDAVRLLRARGLDDEQARRVNDVAHGHPLALVLAAASVRARPDAPPLGDDLLGTFLEQVPPEVVPLVEAASSVRRVTEPILRTTSTTPGPSSTPCAHCRSPSPAPTGCCCTTSSATPWLASWRFAIPMSGAPTADGLPGSSPTARDRRAATSGRSPPT